MLCVVNVPLPLFGVGLDKILVNCQAVNVKPEGKRCPLQPHQVGKFLTFHLPVQNLHSSQTQLGGMFHDLFNRVAVTAKMPVRVG
jgi:hypothetical protein